MALICKLENVIDVRNDQEGNTDKHFQKKTSTTLLETKRNNKFIRNDTQDLKQMWNGFLLLEFVSCFEARFKCTILLFVQFAVFFCFIQLREVEYNVKTVCFK